MNIFSFDLVIQNYIPGEYKTAEFSEYSKGGWLADHSFHGLSAQSPDVVTPYGPCAPKSRNFIVSHNFDFNRKMR